MVIKDVWCDVAMLWCRPSLQIVDLSLLVKQEMIAKTDPVSHVISANYIQYNTHTEVLF